MPKLKEIAKACKSKNAGPYELTLDIMKWNEQKIAVALGTDVWMRPGQLSDLVFDAEGNFVR